MSKKEETEKEQKGKQKNIVSESSKLGMDTAFLSTQEALENGFEKAFTELNTNLITTINSAFGVLETENEKILENNREQHDKYVTKLNDELQSTTNIYQKIKSKKKNQGNNVVENFQRIQNLKKKGKIFSRLLTYCQKKKNNNIKRERILNHFEQQKKYLIFNSWRNLTNSYLKTKIKLVNNQVFKEKTEKMTQQHNSEMQRLQNILINLQNDIQSEIKQRKNLNQLYDLSLKRGVEQFLKETNYIVDFDTSKVPTPNNRSFVQNNNNIALSQKINPDLISEALSNNKEFANTK